MNDTLIPAFIYDVTFWKQQVFIQACNKTTKGTY